MEGLAAILPVEQWARLAAGGVARVFAPASVLLRQGDPANHVVLVLRGRVKVTRVDSAGHTVLLAVRGPGEVLGELGLLDPSHRRTATVTAIDRCSTRIIPTDEFAVVTRELGLEARLLEHLVWRLYEAEEVRTELSVLPAGPRIARCLLRLATSSNQTATPNASTEPPPADIDVGLNQTELGQAAGLHRSTVAVELRKLRRDGVVRTSRGRVVISDITELRRRAGDERFS